MPAHHVDVYGPVVTGTEVRQAVQSTILRWFDAYAHELSRQKGVFVPPVPRDWQTVREMGDVEVAQLPLLVVTAAGTARTERHARGTGYTATWAIGAGVICGDADWEATRALGESYATIVRWAVLQQQSLGIGARVEWVGEAYDEFDTGEGPQFVIGATVTFEVTVDGVVDPYTGPTVVPPDVTVAQQWPDAETIVVTVKGKAG